MSSYLIIKLISNYASLNVLLNLRLLCCSINSIITNWDLILYSKYHTYSSNSKLFLKAVHESSYSITKTKLECLKKVLNTTKKHIRIDSHILNVNNIVRLIKFKGYGPWYDLNKFQLIFITKDNLIESYTITKTYNHDKSMYIICTTKNLSCDYSKKYYKNIDYDIKFGLFNHEEWMLRIDQIKYKFNYTDKQEMILDIIKDELQYVGYNSGIRIKMFHETRQKLFCETFKIANVCFDEMTKNGSIIIQINNKYVHYCKTNSPISKLRSYSFLFEYRSIHNLLVDVMKINDTNIANYVININ
jgi:hypothetical protein